MNIILTISLLKTIVGTQTMLPNEPNEVNESDNMGMGLEIVVKDDVKDEDHVDYTRLFTTDKVCTYVAHNMLYVML